MAQKKVAYWNKEGYITKAGQAEIRRRLKNIQKEVEAIKKMEVHDHLIEHFNAAVQDLKEFYL